LDRILIFKYLLKLQVLENKSSKSGYSGPVCEGTNLPTESNNKENGKLPKYKGENKHSKIRHLLS
jgi:hypothetical protein